MLSLAALAAITSFALAARAEPSSEERALADVRFHEGRELLDKQRYDDACPKFEESERLWPRGGTTLNLATCREKQGKTATAWAAYTRALGLAQKEGRADREEIAKKKIAELQAELSWLVIQVPQELDVSGAVVTRDGTPVGRGAWGVPVPVDPGHHVVVANAPGLPPIEAAVDVGPHGDRRTVTLPRAGGAPSLPWQAVPPASPWGPLPPAEVGALGVVRIHVATTSPGVRLVHGLPGMPPGMNAPVCSAPCESVIDGRYGQSFYFDGDGFSQSERFFVSDRKGDVYARVAPGSSALRTAGVTSLYLGVLGLSGGIACLPVGVILNSHNENGSGLVLGGGIALGVGGAVLVGGILMVVFGRTTFTLADRPPATARAVPVAPQLTPGGVAIAF